MAWGRHGPHATAAEHSAAENIDTDRHVLADVERLGIDADVTERPGRTWEVDGVDSWEPVVPDTWDPPSDLDEDPATADEATWTDAARSEREWADAGAEVSLPPAPLGEAPPAEPPLAEQAPEEAVPPASDAEASAGQPPLGPARMALGLASLAAERMRSEVPAGGGFVSGLGLMRQTTNGLLGLGQRLFEPAARIAAGAVKGAVREAAELPVAGAPVRAALRTRRWLARSAAEGRERLLAAVPPSTADTPHRPSTVENEDPAGGRR